LSAWIVSRKIHHEASQKWKPHYDTPIPVRVDGLTGSGDILQVVRTVVSSVFSGSQNRGVGPAGARWLDRGLACGMIEQFLGQAVIKRLGAKRQLGLRDLTFGSNYLPWAHRHFIISAESGKSRSQGVMLVAVC
jgi:hypothetical protein